MFHRTKFAYWLDSLPQVSTDYDTSSRLYFEPLTLEDVLNVIEVERPDGIIVQFGGQTPLKIATALEKYITDTPIPCASGHGNVRIWGTSPQSIDAAEDRDKWIQVLEKLNIRQPPGGTATSEAEALAEAGKLGYPCMVRPSYVLGGTAMRIVYSDEELKKYIVTAVQVCIRNVRFLQLLLFQMTNLLLFSYRWTPRNQFWWTSISQEPQSWMLIASQTRMAML